jgi:hypothetical protein
MVLQTNAGGEKRFSEDNNEHMRTPALSERTPRL